MDLRESLRIKETERVKLGTKKFDDQLKVAEDRLRVIESGGGLAPEELESARLERDLALRERERFFWEHDTTGAWKGERFGRDLAGILDQSGIERTPEGQVVLKNPEAGKRTHLLQVNMGELDRLNASGDHALGDRGLELTFERVQSAIQEKLKTANPEVDESELLGRFQIYRTAGNDFSVILKDADEVFAETVREALSAPLDISAERSDQDPIPLSASRVTLEEGVSFLNHLDRRLADPKADRRDTITVLREKLQTVNDFEKVRTRAERMASALRPERGEKMSPEKLYEFLKKYTGSLFLESGETEPLDFESFKMRIETLGAHEEHPHEWRKRVFNVAREEALKQFHVRNADRLGDEARIIELVADEFDEKLADRAGFSPRIVSEVESAASSNRPDVRKAEKSEIESFNERIQALGPTAGEQKIAELRLAIDRLSSEAGTNGEKKMALAKSELALELAKRDRATGLYGRGVYFQTLESALEKKQPMTAVAIDMAFLKFFDKEGGAKTGDAAIHAAGRILDAVRREIQEKHGIAVEAFRVGGDEFSLTIQSEDPAIAALVPELLRKHSEEDVGPISAHDGAGPNYQPESLQFNVGIAPASRHGESHEESGPPSAEARRRAADHLNHEADAAVESEKALNRFAFLLGRSLSAARGAEAGALSTLMTYSEKSIFGNIGRAKIDAWTRDIISARKTIAEIVQTELTPFIAEELRRKGKEDVQFSAELVQRLSEELEHTFSGLRIRDLESDLERAEEALGREHEKVVSAKQEIAELRQNRDEIAGLRQKIAAG